MAEWLEEKAQKVLAGSPFNANSTVCVRFYYDPINVSKNSTSDES